MLLLLAGCDGDISGDEIPVGMLLSSVPTTLLEVNDTTVLSAWAYANSGVPIQDAVTWASLEPAVATASTNGRVIGRAPGVTTIRATAGAVTKDVQITVKPRTAVPPSNTVCAGSGPRHYGIVGSGTWLAKDNPHFIRDTVTVSTTLTIEAGALICAYPGARIIVPGPSQLIAAGTAAQPIRFTPTDPVVGWTGAATTGSIVLDQVRVEKAQSIEAGSLRIGEPLSTGSGNLTLRNSVVDSGNVRLSAGVVENTVIRRGNLHAIGTQQGGGTIRIDGVRIEDSPGIAFIVGDNNNITRQPTMNIVTAPVIVRAGSTIVNMALETFLAAWPTPTAQAALLDNASRTVSLWAVNRNVASAHLRGGLTWQLAGFGFGVINVMSLTLDPGAELNMQIYFNVDVLNASGTAQEPITLSSRFGCYDGTPAEVCGITVSDSASSRISNVRVVNSYLRFAH